MSWEILLLFLEGLVEALLQHWPLDPSGRTAISLRVQEKDFRDTDSPTERKMGMQKSEKNVVHMLYSQSHRTPRAWWICQSVGPESHCYPECQQVENSDYLPDGQTSTLRWCFSIPTLESPVWLLKHMYTLALVLMSVTQWVQDGAKYYFLSSSDDSDASQESELLSSGIQSQQHITY